MHMEWHSRKGKGRSWNSDAVSIRKNQDGTLIALVDAAESDKSQALATDWARACTVAIPADASNKPHPELLIQQLKQAHSALRMKYLHERASYLLLFISSDDSTGWLLNAGDCLAGIEQADQLCWINTPHTAASQLQQTGLNPIENAEHVLTRSFKGRRFQPPEWQTLHWPPESDLLVCTDGFWREHLREGTELEHLWDDASHLRIMRSDKQVYIKNDSDSHNLSTEGF